MVGVGREFEGGGVYGEKQRALGRNGLDWVV